jgi:hypothetical protein
MSTVPVKKESSDGRTAAAAGRARGWWQASARYWVCLAVLAVAAAGMHSVTSFLNVYLRKEAVPLKKPLSSFDTRKLGPRYERHPRTDALPPLTADVVESLGTEEYLQVYLRDTEAPPESPTRVAHLFVTYYTGNPDMVPHVPDECYAASGYDLVSRDTRAIPVAGVGAPDDQIPLRVLQFEAGRRSQFALGEAELATVMYFFHTNGEYVTTRNGVRRVLSNPFDRYAYYAKIEVTFEGERGTRPDPDAAVAAAGPLLERVMPVLLEDHIDLSKLGVAETAGPGQS